MPCKCLQHIFIRSFNAATKPLSVLELSRQSEMRSHESSKCAAVEIVLHDRAHSTNDAEQKTFILTECVTVTPDNQCDS